MRAESDRVATRVRQLLGDDAPQPFRGPTEPVGARDSDPDRDHGLAGRDRPTLRRRLSARFGARLGLRLDPGRRAAAVVGAAVLVVGIVTGAWVLADRPQAMAISSAGATRVPGSAPDSGTAHASGIASASGSASASDGLASAGASGAAASAASAPVVVDVAGKVHRPGVYRLPAGSRIDDAIRAAGGALPGVGLTSLDLAARLVDGQQIPVGLRTAAAGGAVGGTGTGQAGGATGAGAAAAPVNLNTATLDQLQTLPGVGPVLGQHILDWRSAHGAFKSVDQLNDVPGIGDVKFAAMRSLATV